MRRPALLLALALLAPAGSAPAWANAAFAFYGTTQTGRTFNRPTEDRSALTGKVVGYGVQPFFVEADATCTLYSVQEFANGLLYLYEGAFDPTSPLANLIALMKDWAVEVGNNAVLDPMSQLRGAQADVPVAAQYPYHPITSTFRGSATTAGGHSTSRRPNEL